mgnify:CR=1 FL=1
MQSCTSVRFGKQYVHHLLVIRFRQSLCSFGVHGRVCAGAPHISQITVGSLFGNKCEHRVGSLQCRHAVGRLNGESVRGRTLSVVQDALTGISFRTSFILCQRVIVLFISSNGLGNSRFSIHKHRAISRHKST